MKIKSQKAPENKGFMIIPRKLLGEIIQNIDSPVSTKMAWFILLYLCRYTRQGEVRRGEVALSISQMKSYFHWNTYQTRMFIKKLEDEHRITQRTKKGIRIISIVGYEDICGDNAAHPSAQERPRSVKAHFEEFWELYHETNYQLTPSDKEAAWKEWKKLTREERILAIENIYEYYCSMKDINHAKKACNYLKDKSFII